MNNPNLAAFQISNNFAPAWNKGKGGPKGLPLTLDFSMTTSVEIDLLKALDQNQIDMVQAIYVDNSLNADPVTFLWDITAMNVTVPAGAQGTFPVITPKQNPKCTVTTDGGVSVGIILLNVPMPYAIWGAAINIPPITLGVITGVWAYTNGSVVTAGTSVELLAANGARKRVRIQNPSANTGKLFIKYGAAATEDDLSEVIIPGGVYDTEAGPLSLQQINVTSDVDGTTFGVAELS